MTTTTQSQKLVAPDTQSGTAVATQAPVLITVQEVAFNTAAAMPMLPTTRRRWAGAGVLVSMRKMFLTSTPDARAPRRDYPRRYGFLEQASMSREMERL